MSENILEINNLSKYFGGLAAVSDCSIKVKRGTITGIIGPNGSGKTTLFNLIAGNLKSSGGNVVFDDENITDVPSYELFSKGLLRTFQIAHEFSNLSVLENLMMVPGNQSGEKIMTALFKPGLVAQEEAVVKEKAKEVVEFLNLGHLSNELAGNLSGGQKKLLELGRTMMVDAKLVLLDEDGEALDKGGRLSMDDTIENIIQDLKDKGKNPYFIPVGGSNHIGSLGYISMTMEMVSQANDMGIEIGSMVAASGSGGTQTGMILGADVEKSGINAVGMGISSDASVVIPKLKDLCNETSKYYDLGLSYEEDDIIFNDNYKYSDHSENNFKSLYTLSNIIDSSYGVGISTDPTVTFVYCMPTTNNLKKVPRYPAKRI